MKKALVICTLALVAVGSSQAVDVYITGATAFRANLYNSLHNNANWQGGTHSENPANGAGATFMTFSGTWGRNDTGGIPNGTAVNFYCSFSGSVEGQLTLISGSTQTFHDLSDTAFTHTADLEFSDVFQNSTSQASAITGVTLIDVGPHGVGVQPFVFVLNDDAKALITGIDAQTYRALGINGILPLAQFNGGTNFGTLIYLTGRNTWSGTRTTCQAETGYGVFNTIQHYAHGSQNPGVNNGHPAIFRTGNAAANSFPLNDGWERGGDVRADLQFNDGTPFVGFLSAGDARSLKSTPTLSSANYGTYNGVPYTRENVVAGRYTAWGYEHLYRRLNSPANQQASKSLAAAIDADLTANWTYDDWPSGIPLGALDANTISRDTDGGTVVSF